jgi:Flp pilus assembly protein TadD
MSCVSHSRRTQKSDSTLQRGVALSEGAPEYLSGLGYAYARSGQHAEAAKLLQQLERLSHRRYVSPYNFAGIYAGLGDTKLAFAWLDKAVADHAPELVLLNVRDEMDSLRSDARYAQVRKRIGLPQ